MSPLRSCQSHYSYESIVEELSEPLQLMSPLRSCQSHYSYESIEELSEPLQL